MSQVCSSDRSVNRPQRDELVPFASWLCQAMKARGLKIRELARGLDISHTAVRDWVQAVRPPEVANVIGLGVYFGVNVSEIIRLLPGGGPVRDLPTIQLPGALTVLTIPVYHQRPRPPSAGAEEGAGQSGDGKGQCVVLVSYVSVVPAAGMSQALFGLEVVGERMEPTLREGQIVVFDRQTTPAVGDIVAVYSEECWFLQRLRRFAGEAVILGGDNPAEAEEVALPASGIVGVAHLATTMLRPRGPFAP